MSEAERTALRGIGVFTPKSSRGDGPGILLQAGENEILLTWSVRERNGASGGTITIPADQVAEFCQLLEVFAVKAIEREKALQDMENRDRDGR